MNSPQEAMTPIILALVLYSIALWKSRVYAYQTAIFCFTIGFVLDCWGTWSMYQITGVMTWNFHSSLGILAIFLMGIVVILGILSLLSLSDGLQVRFRQIAPYAWGVWIFSFVSGLISH